MQKSTLFWLVYLNILVTEIKAHYHAKYYLSPVLTSDTSISISISIRSLCASEDNRDISINIRISKPCVLLMLRLMLMSLLFPVRTRLA